MSLPDLLFGSDTRTPQITIKVFWKLFELVRKRFIRPEKTPKNQSINALHVELSKVDNQAILKNQQIDRNCDVLPLSLDDLLNYTTLMLKFCTNKWKWASLLRQVYFRGGERVRLPPKRM